MPPTYWYPLCEVSCWVEHQLDSDYLFWEAQTCKVVKVFSALILGFWMILEQVEPSIKKVNSDRFEQFQESHIF